jgi:hypothetical protein
MSNSDEPGELIQEYLSMSQLTQQKVGRSDNNNEARETPFFDHSMA